MKITAILALEDGTILPGQSCGAEGEISGEVVFNTSMTGYQEVLTDPSYKGQFVAMTYPQIGNYGITADDNESSRPHLSGLIVRELCRTPPIGSRSSPCRFPQKHGICGIEGLDTRASRFACAIRAPCAPSFSTTDLDAKRLLAKARKSPSMAGADLAQRHLRGKYRWTEGYKETPRALHVVVYDFGVKFGILRCLPPPALKSRSSRRARVIRRRWRSSPTASSCPTAQPIPSPSPTPPRPSAGCLRSASPCSASV